MSSNPNHQDLGENQFFISGNPFSSSKTAQLTSRSETETPNQPQNGANFVPDLDAVNARLNEYNQEQNRRAGLLSALQVQPHNANEAVRMVNVDTTAIHDRVREGWVHRDGDSGQRDANGYADIASAALSLTTAAAPQNGQVQYGPPTFEEWVNSIERDLRRDDQMPERDDQLERSFGRLSVTASADRASAVPNVNSSAPGTQNNQRQPPRRVQNNQPRNRQSSIYVEELMRLGEISAKRRFGTNIVCKDRNGIPLGIINPSRRRTGKSETNREESRRRHNYSSRKAHARRRAVKKGVEFDEDAWDKADELKYGKPPVNQRTPGATTNRGTTAPRIVGLQALQERPSREQGQLRGFGNREVQARPAAGNADEDNVEEVVREDRDSTGTSNNTVEKYLEDQREEVVWQYWVNVRGEVAPAERANTMELDVIEPYWAGPYYSRAEVNQQARVNAHSVACEHWGPGPWNNFIEEIRAIDGLTTVILEKKEEVRVRATAVKYLVRNEALPPGAAIAPPISWVATAQKWEIDPRGQYSVSAGERHLGTYTERMQANQRALQEWVTELRAAWEGWDWERLQGRGAVAARMQQEEADLVGVEDGMVTKDAFLREAVRPANADSGAPRAASADNGLVVPGHSFRVRIWVEKREIQGPRN